MNAYRENRGTEPAPAAVDEDGNLEISERDLQTADDDRGPAASQRPKPGNCAGRSPFCASRGAWPRYSS
jgi:hypothetical protein